jgi:hypothetical protein
VTGYISEERKWHLGLADMAKVKKTSEETPELRSARAGEGKEEEEW